MPDTTDPLDSFTGDDRIVAEAQLRFDRCVQWESSWRAKADDDERFREGDSDNNFQWPDRFYNDRLQDGRPTLTINKVAEFCLAIVNDARQNKPGVNIRPTGGGATYAAAQTFQQIIRHIEYESSAERIYDDGIDNAVTRGIAYWRVLPKYVDDRSFDQYLCIESIQDQKGVYLDPDIKNPDGLDGDFAFIFSDLANDKFRSQYPSHLDAMGAGPLGSLTSFWSTKDYTRLAEYYRRKPVSDTLHLIVDERGNESGLLASMIDKALLREVLGGMEARGIRLRERKVTRKTVEWFKLAGSKIIERTISPGQYIPIVRVLVKQTVINGIMDRKGHVRNLKDAQRMYNYNASGAVEHGALQTKVPWTAPAEAISEYQGYWDTANTVNHSVLPYRVRDAQGNPIPYKPERLGPPQSSELFLRGMETAEKQMMMASGQWNESFGQPTNAESGVAINSRQRKGDNATYHWPDAQAKALVATGKILIDMIPLIYDTERVIKIKADDGDEQDIHIDPTAKDAYSERQVEGESMKTRQKAAIIFNPGIGQYAVVADVGPSYLTRRQEAFNALTQLLAQRPEYASVIGDLFFLVSDFPMADVLAARMRKIIPGHITGDAEPPEVQQLKQVIAQLQAQMAELTNDAAQEELKAMRAEVERAQEDLRTRIEEYDAVTRRLTAVTELLPMDASELKTMIHGLVGDAIQTQQSSIREQASAAETVRSAMGNGAGA